MEKKLKKCLYCDKEIQLAARKCKHCGGWQNEINNQKKRDKELSHDIIMAIFIVVFVACCIYALVAIVQS